jgi:uncharacterized RDD family membrane protein YckC
MPTERMQRRIDALLDQSEAASDAGNWREVTERAAAVLGLDEENRDAQDLLRMGEAALERRSEDEGASGPRADLAWFGSRMFAYLIDAVFYLVVVVTVYLVAVALIVLLTDLSWSSQSSETEAWGVAAFVSFLLVWTYNSRGVSPGKALAGIRIVSENGGVPGIGPGLVRTIIAVFSGLFLGLGYLSAAWDENMQTWHDKAARTLVVTRRSK